MRDTDDEGYFYFDGVKTPLSYLGNLNPNDIAMIIENNSTIYYWVRAGGVAVGWDNDDYTWVPGYWDKDHAGNYFFGVLREYAMQGNRYRWQAGYGRSSGGLANGVSAFGFVNSVKENLIRSAGAFGDLGIGGIKYLNAVRGFGVATSIVGIGISGNRILDSYIQGQGGINQVNGWDVADFSIGIGGLTTTGLVTFGLASNPVGWFVGAGVSIYFTSRFFYKVSKGK